MRLWSLHPSLLDRQGLLGLWREGLLAQKVLKGETRGYKNHPQLIRFKQMEYPVSGLAHYLWIVVDEANRVREYNFNEGKLDPRFPQAFKITKGQLQYEFYFLLSKVKGRDYDWYVWLKRQKPTPHPMAEIVDILSLCEWEKEKKI